MMITKEIKIMLLMTIVKKVMETEFQTLLLHDKEIIIVPIVIVMKKRRIIVMKRVKR